MELSDNELSGEMPAELGRLTNLESLDIRNNQLSGQIPAEMGQAFSLRRLYLSRNELSECIPVTIEDVRYNDLDRLCLAFCGSESQQRDVTGRQHPATLF